MNPEVRSTLMVILLVAVAGIEEITIGDTVGWFGYAWLPRADGLTGLKVRINGVTKTITVSITSAWVSV